MVRFFILFSLCLSGTLLSEQPEKRSMRKDPNKARQKKLKPIKSHIKEADYVLYRELFSQYEGDILMQRVDRIVWCIKHPHHPHMQEAFTNILKEIRNKRFTPNLIGSQEWIKEWRMHRNTELWRRVHSTVQSAFTKTRNAEDVVRRLEEALAKAKRNTTQKQGALHSSSG